MDGSGFIVTNIVKKDGKNNGLAAVCRSGGFGWHRAGGGFGRVGTRLGSVESGSTCPADRGWRLHGGERRSRSGKGVRPANSRGGRRPRAQTHAGRPDGTPLSPGSSVTVPLNIRRRPPSAALRMPPSVYHPPPATRHATKCHPKPSNGNDCPIATYVFSPVNNQQG